MRRWSGRRMANQEQIDRLKRAFRVASAAWDRASARTVPGEIACRAGCFGCCVGLFDISLPEAALVRAGVARLSGEDRLEADWVFHADGKAAGTNSFYLSRKAK